MSVYTIFNKDTVTPDEYIDAFVNYLVKAHKEDIEEILHDPENTIHFTITTNGLDLMNTSVRLGTLLFAYPIEMFEYFNEGIKKAQKKIMKETNEPGFLFKPNVHGRFKY
jgi:hypothetical protein